MRARRKAWAHVALKLLPAAFATDPERLARFDREAQLLVVLNWHEELKRLVPPR